MGKNLLEFFRFKVKKSWKIAFLSAFIIGLLTHMYKFTNALPNHDSLYNYYSDQNVVGSGRWFLSIACGFTSYFDLPWIIGIVSIALAAVTAVIIVDIFKIENPILIILTGGVLVSFPSITETFFFEYTADGYMLAMLLSALSVRLSMLGDNKKSHAVLSAVFLCLSCGIYQAYVSFALVLALCYFINTLIENTGTKKERIKWIFRQVGIYFSALLSYFVIWKVCMYFQNTQANSYQGIDSVGFSLNTVLGAVPNAVRSLVLFFLEWNVLEHGITLYGVLSILFLCAFAGVVVTVLVKSGIGTSFSRLCLFIVCIAALPIAACLWYIVSTDVQYRPMMLQCVCVIYVFTAVLYERWSSVKIKNLFAIFLCTVIFNYAIMANISYFYMDKEYKASYATGLEMVSRIHLLDEEISEIAVVGNLSRENCKGADKIHILSQCLEQNLLYDDRHTVLFLNNTFNCSYSRVSEEKMKSLEQSEEVADMGVWPDKDSIQIIDGTIVVKLAEPDRTVEE